MYHIEDTVSAIKELQRLLDLNQTGIYDEKTRNEVLEIQSEYGLARTGIANYETFSRITEKYLENRSGVWSSDYLFDANFPYVKNDFDDNVEKINYAIAMVLREYTYEGIEPRGKFLGNDTIDSANYLRNIFQMSESNEIDEKFLNRIMQEMRAIEIKRKYGL